MSNNDLTLKEAAEHFRVSVQTIRRWIKDGKITAELRDSPYGQQYFIPAHEVQTASEIKDVVKVDHTVDVTSLARIMSSYIGEREEALLNVLESIQTEIRESIQRQEQRQEELVKEIAATREENKELRNLIGERLEDRDRKLMETLRALQQSAEQEKKKKSWWTWKK